MLPLYELAVFQTKKMLTNISNWLDKAEATAKAGEYKVDVLLQSRLAPNQFPLIRQIQAVCDSAKFAAARLAGVEAPSHPDTEESLEEIRARLNTVITYLGTFEPSQFEGVGGRELELPFLPGQKILAQDYLNEMALPNFYFHATTTYAILRHNGVDVGKRDFIGSLKMF